MAEMFHQRVTPWRTEEGQGAGTLHVMGQQKIENQQETSLLDRTDKRL